MNGLRNGQYVCGEVPFEKDEVLIRSYGGWRQSDNASDEDYRRDYMNEHSIYELDAPFPSVIDQDEDDRERWNFPDVRVYFTLEEKQMLLHYYPTLSIWNGTRTLCCVCAS